MPLCTFQAIFKYLKNLTKVVKNICTTKIHNSTQYLQFIRLDNEIKLCNIVCIELIDFISITKLMEHQTYSKIF